MILALLSSQDLALLAFLGLVWLVLSVALGLFVGPRFRSRHDPVERAEDYDLASGEWLRYHERRVGPDRPRVDDTKRAA